MGKKHLHGAGTNSILEAESLQAGEEDLYKYTLSSKAEEAGGVQQSLEEKREEFELYYFRKIKSSPFNQISFHTCLHLIALTDHMG